MMATRLSLKFFIIKFCLITGAFLCSLGTHAQTALQPSIVVTGKAEPTLDAEAAQLGLSAQIKDAPQSLSVITQSLLREAKATTLSRTLALDASLSDAYNAVGYIENVQIRGFLLDSVNNYQRNGLPTLNYAPFAAENKSQIEILKGVSGLQASVSAPGGLINYVVKRPTNEPISELNLSIAPRGGKSVSLDVSRADASNGIALRLNAAHEELRPAVFHAEGARSLLSAYLTWAASTRTSVEVDLEWQRKRQLEQPGFGLLDASGTGTATTLPRLAFNDPTAIDPRTNLNAQPWSLPYEQKFWTAAVSVKHVLSDATTLKFALQTQRLVTNDRIAFADGSGGIYPGASGNGDIDLYDFRSENERRSLTAAQAGITHRFVLGGMPHALNAALQSYQQRFAPEATQAYNYVGVTNQYAPVTLNANPSKEGLNSPNKERVTALVVSDQIALTQEAKLFIGLRSSRIERSSALSNGQEGTAYSQQITTPSGGITYAVSPYLTGYISLGQGIESEVVPNRAEFINAGQALPALKSRQKEIGIKWQPSARLLATAAVFDIEKPYSEKVIIDADKSLLVAGGKHARHTGLELSATGAVTPQLSVAASAMRLNARYTHAIDATLIGQHVTNVAPFTAALFADYKLEAIKGLSVNTRLRYDGKKPVFTDRSVELPAATQWDLGTRYKAGDITWRLSVENVLNRASWKEAPTQPWGGIYLFPSAARSISLTTQIDL
jgi:iron complex outermembrane recepter protein